MFSLSLLSVNLSGNLAGAEQFHPEGNPDMSFGDSAKTDWF
jgi:hypothetical protein